jgi:hypothetical protein
MNNESQQEGMWTALQVIVPLLLFAGLGIILLSTDLVNRLQQLVQPSFPTAGPVLVFLLFVISVYVWLTRDV